MKLKNVLAAAHHFVSYTWLHPANREHRLAAVANAIRVATRDRVFGRPMLVPIGCRGRMWSETVFGMEFAYANPYAWNEMRFWARHLAPGDIFIDVGANVGAYSLWASDHGAHVIAIEPDPEVAARLKANIALNPWMEVELLEVALADKRGPVQLLSERGGRSRLAVGEAVDHMMEVEAWTLDEVLGERAAAGVKIDVEGAERLVLEGARRALGQGRVKVFQLEWDDRSLQLLGEEREPAADLLAQAGYVFARPDEQGRLRPCIPLQGADLFAYRPD